MWTKWTLWSFKKKSQWLTVFSDVSQRIFVANFTWNKYNERNRPNKNKHCPLQNKFKLSRWYISPLQKKKFNFPFDWHDTDNEHNSPNKNKHCPLTANYKEHCAPRIPVHLETHFYSRLLSEDNTFKACTGKLTRGTISVFLWSMKTEIRTLRSFKKMQIVDSVRRRIAKKFSRKFHVNLSSI